MLFRQHIFFAACYFGENFVKRKEFIRHLEN